MTLPLSRDDTAGILGVDLAHHGLYCRFKGCREHFDPSSSDSPASLHTAGLCRDAHEVAVHDYHHEQVPTQPWNFTQRFSRRGHSTMK